MPSYISVKHYKYINYVSFVLAIFGFYKFSLLFWSANTFLLRETEFLSMLTDDEEFVFEDELDLPYFVFPDYNGSYTQYVKDTFDYTYSYLNETFKSTYEKTYDYPLNNPVYKYRLELIDYEGPTDNDLEIYSNLINKFRECQTKDFITPLNTRSNWKNYTFLPKDFDEFDVFKQ